MFSLLAVALAALVFASGCGGSDSSSASASADEITVETGSLSKKEFITRADAICEAARNQWNQGYATAFERHPPKPTKGAERAWLNDLIRTSLVPPYEKMIAEISALGAPSEDKQKVTAFLKTFQRNLNALDQKPAIVTENYAPFAKATKLAQAYGANGCATSF